MLTFLLSWVPALSRVHSAVVSLIEIKYKKHACINIEHMAEEAAPLI